LINYFLYMSNKDNLNASIGTKMRTIRNNNNLTLEKVAKYLEVSPQQLQKYETNITKVPISKMYIFLNIFNIPLEEFLKDIS
jgi:transcriptional regulator with XRE-family HTH domain